MKNKPRNNVVGEWDISLIPIDEPLACAACGKPTRWRTPRQKVKGIHPLCQPRTWMTRASNALHWATVDMVAETIGFEIVEEVDRDSIPIIESDIGPCAKCQTPHRRYGAYGRPLCKECENSR